MGQSIDARLAKLEKRFGGPGDLLEHSLLQLIHMARGRTAEEVGPPERVIPRGVPSLRELILEERGQR